MWYMANNFVLEWLECLQILCYDTADKNCPVAKEIGLHMLVREKLCKLDFFDWLFTLVIFQLGSVDPFQYGILMSPVYGAICM